MTASAGEDQRIEGWAGKREERDLRLFEVVQRLPRARGQRQNVSRLYAVMAHSADGALALAQGFSAVKTVQLPRSPKTHNRRDPSEVETWSVSEAPGPVLFRREERR